ncbi:tetratricopeptide repeat protein [Haloferula sargassicola]|uniref:Uncharacterized protein n=1 Tax=Haloferula sargassicola TaxID=490096 RepID=A0ABP9US32_9BACT
MEQLLFIHLSGLTGADLSARLDSGGLAAFTRLVGAGAAGPLRRAGEPAAAATAVSLGTGRHAGVHGVMGSMVPDPTLPYPRLAGRHDRRCPYFWEILAAAGVPVLAVNWPASARQPGLDAIPPDFADARFVQPPADLAARWHELIVRPDEIDAASLGHFLPHPPQPLVLASELAAQASRHAVVTSALESGGFRGIALHEPFPAAAARCGVAAEKTWDYLDLLLARLQELAGGNWTLVIAATPPPGADGHGFLLARGPGIAADGLLPLAGVLDLAPSLLTRFGLAPLASDGQLIRGLVPPALPRQSAPSPPAATTRPVATFTGRDRTLGLLRALEGLPAPDAPATDEWQHRRGLALKLSGDLPGAHRDLSDLFRRQPEQPGLLLELVEVEFHLGWHQRAEEHLRLADLLLPGSELPKTLLARLWAETGRRDEALSLLGELPPRPEKHALLTLLRLGRWAQVISCEGVQPWMQARALLGLRDFPGAESMAREALAHDPFHALSHELLGIALTRQARTTEAAAALRNAIHLEPARHTARVRLFRLLRDPALKPDVRRPRMMARHPEPPPHPAPSGPEAPTWRPADCQCPPRLVRALVAPPGHLRDGWRSALETAGLQAAHRPDPSPSAEDLAANAECIQVIPTLAVAALPPIHSYRLLLVLPENAGSFLAEHRAPAGLAPFLLRHFAGLLPQPLPANFEVLQIHGPPAGADAIRQAIGFLTGRDGGSGW